MERIDGESRPRAIARKPDLAGVRARLAEDTGHALATIHSVDVTSLPGLPQSGVEQQLALVRKFLDDGPAPRPALELGLRWSRCGASAQPSAPDSPVRRTGREEASLPAPPKRAGDR